MEIVYAGGGVTSAEVHERMADAPSYSAVRAQMRILAEKGVLRFRREGMKYVFEPVVPVTEARESALARVVKSFFDGSAVSVVASLLDSKELDVTDDEIQELKKLIKRREKKS